MTDQSPSDDAMKAFERVRVALVAFADEDQQAVLAQVNEATDAEARWMVSHLIATVGFMADELAKRSKRGSTRASVLRAVAAEVAEESPRMGAEVVITEAMKREGLL